MPKTGYTEKTYLVLAHYSWTESQTGASVSFLPTSQKVDTAPT